MGLCSSPGRPPSTGLRPEWDGNCPTAPLPRAHGEDRHGQALQVWGSPRLTGHHPHRHQHRRPQGWVEEASLRDPPQALSSGGEAGASPQPTAATAGKRQAREPHRSTAASSPSPQPRTGIVCGATQPGGVGSCRLATASLILSSSTRADPPPPVLPEQNDLLHLGSAPPGHGSSCACGGGGRGHTSPLLWKKIPPKLLRPVPPRPKAAHQHQRPPPRGRGEDDALCPLGLPAHSPSPSNRGWRPKRLRGAGNPPHSCFLASCPPAERWEGSCWSQGRSGKGFRPTWQGAECAQAPWPSEGLPCPAECVCVGEAEDVPQSSSPGQGRQGRRPQLGPRRGVSIAVPGMLLLAVAWPASGRGTPVAGTGAL